MSTRFDPEHIDYYRSDANQMAKDTGKRVYVVRTGDGYDLFTDARYAGDAEHVGYPRVDPVHKQGSKNKFVTPARISSAHSSYSNFSKGKYAKKKGKTPTIWKNGVKYYYSSYTRKWEKSKF